VIHVTLRAPNLKTLVRSNKVLIALRVLRHGVTTQTLPILNTLKWRQVTPLTIVLDHAVRVRDGTTTPITIPFGEKRIRETSGEHKERCDERESPHGGKVGLKLKLSSSPRDDLCIREISLGQSTKGKGHLIPRDTDEKREVSELNHIPRGKSVLSYPRVVDAHARERVHIRDKDPVIFLIYLGVNKREPWTHEDDVRRPAPTDQNFTVIEASRAPLDRAVTVLPLVNKEYSHDLPEEKHREYVDSDRDAQRD
jgi:hypothetical protein